MYVYHYINCNLIVIIDVCSDMSIYECNYNHIRKQYNKHARENSILLLLQIPPVIKFQGGMLNPKELHLTLEKIQ